MGLNTCRHGEAREEGIIARYYEHGLRYLSHLQVRRLRLRCRFCAECGEG